MSEPILKIENASISFGQGDLFSEFNATLNLGEMYCLTGESGKGKTSLLKAILGFVPLDHGKISLNGVEVGVKNLDITRRFTSWIPQELALPSDWVKEMVHIPFNLKANRNIKFSKDKLFSYFEELGLDPQLYDRRVVEISGGQRQRIVIAATAMLQKPLMIIDEPTSALDHESVVRVVNFLRNRKNEGVAVLAVTHDSYFASHCDKELML